MKEKEKIKMIKYDLKYLPKDIREKVAEAQKLREEADNLKAQSEDYKLVPANSLFPTFDNGEFWTKTGSPIGYPKNPDLVEKVINLERNADKLEREAFSLRGEIKG